MAILSFTGDDKTPALVLAKTNPAKNELVSAVGHDLVAGRWTKTEGLVVKSGAVSFQTDAAISAEFTGGPVLDGSGALAGVLVSRPADTDEGFWPVAVPATTVARWLDGEVELTAAPEMIETAGTASVLTKAGPSGLTEASGLMQGNADHNWYIKPLPPPPPTPPGVCVARCGGPSARPSPSYSSGSSSYSSNNGSAELGQALGQLGAQLLIKGISELFRGIGKLFSKKSKSSAADLLIDNRPSSRAAQAPQPPPDPLKPSSLSLTVSRSSLAQGEELETVATVGFTGTEGSKAGHLVSFTVKPAGKLTCPPGTTDAGGIASVKCVAILVEGDRTFDSLEDEARRRRGQKTPGRVKRTPAKSDPIATLKERAEGSQDKLVIEEEKRPMTGTDTPGLDKTIDTGDPEPYVIKGDRVTLSASLLGMMEKLLVDVMDRPCDGVKELRGAPGELQCRPNLGENGRPLPEGTWHSEAPEPTKPETGEKVPPKTVADLENFQPFITDHGLVHILDGDDNGGGHRAGAGKGKSEFPEGWDGSKIKENIQSVLADPGSKVTQEKGRRIGVEGIRDGVSIKVIVEGPKDPNYGEVVTAYPKNRNDQRRNTNNSSGNRECLPRDTGSSGRKCHEILRRVS
ncbi:MAG: EndoU domain-containing protein [Elusimicrobiota bacterium]|nr:MAG: EndoU domain-containing protein [Elusimicrobiota bacterium]